MAGVKIQTAPPLETPLSQLDARTAQTHAMLRALDILNRLSDDCRPIAALIEEAESAGWVGYSNRDEFISESFGKPVEVIDLALEGLELFDPAKPVRFDDAVARGRTARERTQAAAANPETGNVLPRGGDKKSEHAKSIGNLPIDTQAERAEAAGIGERTQRKLDALARHAPHLLDRVKNGAMSAHAAAIEAGIVKPPCPVRLGQRAFAKMTAEQRAEFLMWCSEYQDNI